MDTWVGIGYGSPKLRDTRSCPCCCWWWCWSGKRGFILISDFGGGGTGRQVVWKGWKWGPKCHQMRQIFFGSTPKSFWIFNFLAGATMTVSYSADSSNKGGGKNCKCKQKHILECSVQAEGNTNFLQFQSITSQLSLIVDWSCKRNASEDNYSIKPFSSRCKLTCLLNWFSFDTSANRVDSTGWKTFLRKNDRISVLIGKSNGSSLSRMLKYVMLSTFRKFSSPGASAPPTQGSAHFAAISTFCLNRIFFERASLPENITWNFRLQNTS